jgi:non-ribosomal peptide synthetase component F/lauroyl/myristoyl acyltransferase
MSSPSTSVEMLRSEVAQLPFDETNLNGSILDRFRRVINALPANHLAYVDDEESFTYAELDQHSDQLAAALIEQLEECLEEVDGADKQLPIALLLPHEFVSLVGILGTLKSGHFYVPLDENQGEALLQQTLKDCAPPVLVTTSALHDLAVKLLGENAQIPIVYTDALPPHTLASSVAIARNPQAYTCIQYTSGSTGLPRGILRTDAQSVQSGYLAAHDLGYRPSDRVAHLFSYAHAATTRVILGGLLNGVTIYAHKIKEISPVALYEWVQQLQITQLHISAGVMRGLGDLPAAYPLLSSIRAIYTIGEAVQRPDLQRLWRFLPDDCRVVMALGSTEANTYARLILDAGNSRVSGDSETAWEGERIPAGYSPPSVEVAILDEEGHTLPPGSVGEMAVRSRYLSAGYWNQPELTTAKFLPDPDGGDRRIFLTGDMGQMNADGLLKHLGRKDFMVKIRGYRVELEAIESELRKLQTIQEGVVTTQRLASGDHRLVAYVVPSTEAKITTGNLRAQLAATLPDHMIPSLFIMMKALPLTVGGKVARKDLPPPGKERPELAVPYVAPSSELEHHLCELWAELLHIAPVGVEDDFFDLGGDSLLSTRMALQVEQQLGHLLPSAFFRKPTVAHLASLFQPDAAPLPTPVAAESKHLTEVYQPLEDARPIHTRVVKLLRGHANLKFHRHNALEGWVRHLSYRQGCRWFAWWAGQPLVVNTLYRTEYENFQRMLEELEVTNVSPRQAFQQSLTGYLIRATERTKRSTPLGRGYFPVLQALPYRFARTLVQEIEEAGSDPEKLDALATVSGFSHLQDAYKQGRGVILLSYHHAAGRHTAATVGRRLQSNEILTLSHVEALAWHRIIHKQGTESSLLATGAAYVAELTLRAQQMLRQGDVLQILNDYSLGPADALPISIGRRSFQLKTGFAELALDTGAVIIPSYATPRPNGQIHTAFHAPLQPEDTNANRDQKIQSLMSQYAQFLETSWHMFPESLDLFLIKHYLRRPLASLTTTT